MNKKAFAVKWDNGYQNPITWRVWFPDAPIVQNGQHLSATHYQSEAIAQKMADKWNTKRGGQEA